ncbi:MAG: hypothetical protein NUK63_04630 [Candidatus Bathyarchaeum tardum]|nr:MAG: hypothetical protein NUK63_04630 [Candidatus Bathyarchaeum tardum]
MLDLLAFGFWIALGTYLVWYFFKAKTVQPLTIDDLALTWKIHKQQSGCKSTRIHGLIKENDEIIGFKCDCGYKFIQQRLITQRSVNPAPYVKKISQQKHDELLTTAVSEQ